ncbi:cytochrome P450 78A9-like [Euphorbia lathyris]|uniref:cytochrome P450 78A9-like n=1 Tax=Euphorbia lathyris TaxID=212925 RepID=UPI003313992B
MSTNLDSLWVFGLASKCRGLTQDNIAWSVIIIALALALFFITLLHWSHPGGSAWGRYYLNRGFIAISKPIPGPKGLPFIGSMNLMTSLAHRKIAAAAETFKAMRLMAFSLGNTRVIVTCHPEVAKEILHSAVFADRPVKESAYRLMFDRAIGFAPYGVYWRTLRRIASIHLFCPKQIKAAESQRRIIASQMVSLLKNHHQNQNCITVRGVLKRASLNNMMSSVFGKEYTFGSVKNDEFEELRVLVDEGYDLLGTLNWSDHLSCLADLDPQKVRFRCANLIPKVNRFVSRIIAEHRVSRGVETRDFVDVLLSLEGSDKLTEGDMIAVLWEMIFRGTDTIAVLIEWILARITLHPDVQSKVHDELDKVVGRSKGVDESDIIEMVYLQAAVKEVLRLHPPGPLLSWARLAITDTTIDGYHVPAGTTAMVNMWAISRDQEFWVDPLKFNPFRFIEQPEFSVFGSDLRLAPFGSGRRTCPGKNLGLSTVTFWVASLLHEFEWESLDDKCVDLSEVLGLSCEMANPLTVKLLPRRQ